MAVVPSLSKPLVNMRGPLGDILRGARDGLGAGTIANIVDKKLLQGKLTAAGIGLGQSINGKPITLNATDAVALLISSGLKFSRGSMIASAITIGIKKWAEAFDYIDPPTPLARNDPRATNVTSGRIQRDEQRRERTPEPQTAQYTVFPNLWGGQYR